MCRIAGIINRNGKQSDMLQSVSAMCSLMAHGGPDDEGFTRQQADFVFGHRRLALIDLSPAGHQPMYYQELCIVFNGEIYNYLELKEELIQRGNVFSTATDTEVILAGFAAWGEAVFQRLEGMFAFALYNDKTKITYLVRDQSAIKPLYYSTQSDQLVFASEVKAFKIPGLSYEENPDWKTYLLAFGHIPHPFTTLKTVYSLSGGHFLKWEHQSASFQILPFAESRQPLSTENSTDAIRLIQTQMEKAVKKHLISDAPIGVFLSGGIDSSILTLLADKVVHQNLKTLSINFAEEAYSEEKFQQLIAGKTRGTHTSYRVTQKDLDDNLDTILAAMDQPSNDAINSWFVNKCAKENGLKAVLSGIGADELFGGYPSFKRIGAIKLLKYLPKFLLRLADKLPSDRLKRLYYLSYSNPVGEYLFLRGFFTPSAIAKILHIPKKNIDELLESYPIDAGINQTRGAERASWMECNLFMKNQLLKDTDFMSMTHAIEVRVPFLDQELIKALEKIKPAIRFDEKRPKGLLINSFKALLPEAIWNRPKMGFTFPLQQWMRENKKITDPALYRHNVFSASLMKRFIDGKMHWSKAYALYQVFR